MKALVIYAGAKAPDYTNNLKGIDEITYEHISEKYYRLNHVPEFEVVIAHHCLPLIESGDVLKEASKMAALVKIGGELWLITPCYEWCAAQAEENQPNPLIHTVLFGSKEEHHRTAYTLLWLRSIIEAIGLVPYSAVQEMYEMHMGEKTVQLIQNHVIGHKIRENKVMENPADDPKNAIVIAHK